MDAILGAVLGAMTVIIAAYLAHRLESQRDRANRRRELRTAHLLDAFLRLEHLLQAGLTRETDKELSAALLDVQIFGDAKEATLARQAIDDIVDAMNQQEAETGSSDGAVFDVESLRRHLLRDLRSELLLDPNIPTPKRLEIEWAEEGESESRTDRSGDRQPTVEGLLSKPHWQSG